MSEFDDQQKHDKKIVNFPQSRAKPKHTQGEVLDLGVSTLAKQLGSQQKSLIGHWCSSCKGIWYGHNGECECPACGNRNG